MLLHRAAPAAAYDIIVIKSRSAYDLLTQFMKKCNGTRHGKSPRKIEKQGKNGYGLSYKIFRLKAQNGWFCYCIAHTLHALM